MTASSPDGKARPGRPIVFVGNDPRVWSVSLGEVGDQEEGAPVSDPAANLGAGWSRPRRGRFPGSHRIVAGRGRPPQAAARRAGLEFVEKLLPTKLTSTCASGRAVAAGRPAVLWELRMVEQRYRHAARSRPAASRSMPGFVPAGEWPGWLKDGPSVYGVGIASRVPGGRSWLGARGRRP
jgi:hypothetical protein